MLYLKDWRGIWPHIHLEVLKMTGKEIISLIEKLEMEGMGSEKIIEIIKYIEKHDPEKD